MNSEKLSSFKEELEEEAEKLKVKEESLREELSELRAEGKKIASLLRTIDGSGKRKQSKPSAKASEVLEIILAFLKKVPTIKQDKLFELLEGQIEKLEMSKSGLKLRFNEALSNAQVLVATEGVSLAKQEVRASA